MLFVDSRTLYAPSWPAGLALLQAGMPEPTRLASAQLCAIIASQPDRSTAQVSGCLVTDSLTSRRILNTKQFAGINTQHGSRSTRCSES